ncbi:MAG TPA: alpha-galactosidase, partial [Tepidisphaeraceae bacterium]|nr:alpha-galactosidase [Tepidisphaeraceae bacterium]
MLFTLQRKIVGTLALFLAVRIGSPHAIASESPRSVDVSTDDTSVRVQVIDDRPAVVSLVCRATGFDWIGGAAAAEPIPLIDVAEVGGVRRTLRWRYVPVSVPDPNTFDHSISFVCDDPPLELVSTWEARPGPGPVEHRVIIRNKGREAVMLPAQQSLAMRMRAPAGHEIRQWWVDKGAGTPTPGGIHTRAVIAGTESVLRCWPSGRDEPRDPIPWMSVQDTTAGQGWYAGVEFTARVEMAIKAEPPAKDSGGMPLHLSLGLQREERFPFFTRVPPGESFEAPPVFIGCHAGDVDDGANRLRRWVGANLVPPTGDDRYPLLVNNSWGGGMGVDERMARRMIDESADLGIEMFHIDAGWFRAVGDWRADPAKFPRGLAPISEYAHQRGLKFGLWVGWTQGGNSVEPEGRHQVLSV